LLADYSLICLLTAIIIQIATIKPGYMQICFLKQK